MYDSGSFSLPEIKYINFVPPSVSGCHGLMTHYSLTKFIDLIRRFENIAKLTFGHFGLKLPIHAFLGVLGAFSPFPCELNSRPVNVIPGCTSTIDFFVE